MLIPSTRHALRTRKYMSTMYILVTFHQSLDRLYRKVAGGTVFDRRVQAVEPPSRYIIAPPFTAVCELSLIPNTRSDIVALESGKPSFIIEIVVSHDLEDKTHEKYLRNPYPVFVVHPNRSSPRTWCKSASS